MSARQMEAAARRERVEARRDKALADVEAEEADLADRMDVWRDAPELIDPTAYDAATRTKPHRIEEKAPAAPEATSERATLAQQAARAAPGDVGFPWFSVVVGSLLALAGVAGGILAWPTVGLSSGSGALGLLVGSALGIIGPLVGVVLIVPALGRRSSTISTLAARNVNDTWPERWRALQAGHLEEMHAWERRRDDTREEWDRAESERATWATRLVRGDVVAVEESVAASLGDLDFPFEAICRVEVPDANTAYVLLDLPEIEDVLPETRTKVLKDGTKKEVKRPKGERLAPYANLVCGLGLVVARSAFIAGPTLRTIHVAAYTQRKQKRKDEIADDYVYEVAVAREADAAIDHADVDPVAEIERLGARMKRAASGELAKIAAPTWLDATGG